MCVEVRSLLPEQARNICFSTSLIVFPWSGMDAEDLEKGGATRWKVPEPGIQVHVVH